MTILMGTHGIAPYVETSGADELSTINLAVLGQLMILDEGFNVKPSLLSDAHFDFKRNVYVLRLRPDLRFHNGRLANSSDLEFSLIRGFFSENRSFYRTYLSNIKGIDAATGKKYKSGVVSGVKIVDSLTIEVELSVANPAFLPSLVRPYFSLVPQESLDETLLTWKTFPIGVGPYKVVSPGFKDGKVLIEKVSKDLPGETFVEIYTEDRLSTYDISNVSSAKVLHASQFFREMPGAVTTIFFSRLNPLGANPHFRKAVSYLIDRSKLSNGVAGSVPSNQLLPRHFWGRGEGAGLQDIAKAKNEISKIPVELVAQNWRFSQFLGSSHSPDLEYLASEIERQFKSVGLHFSKVNSTEKFVSEKSAKEIPIFVKSRVTDYVDPLIMFSSFRKGGHDPFLSPENDQKYEKLYQSASVAKLSEDRIETVRRLSQYVVEQNICVPLLERRYAFYFDNKKVESIGAQHLPNTIVIQNIKRA